MPRRNVKPRPGAHPRHPLDAILRPRSVAVIGASRHKGSIGWAILDNLLNSEFKGMIFPVNPRVDVIHSMKCYHDVMDIPDDVDLAMIVIPKEQVVRAVDRCGRKGVRGLVVISAGFKEVGGGGPALEAKLKRVIDRHGMRMVGPNCMGVLNTDPGISLNATFGSSYPPHGNVGFMSQSGALGEVILAMACQINLGISMFVSMGNKTDVSGNDLLEYWEKDPSVKLILMYLESFGDASEFTTIARRITPVKPIIAVKAGRTAAGARAVSSHTGALTELDTAAETLFEQCGVIRVPKMEEMFSLAAAFSTQPLPKGDRIAIVTNAGGPGILATDACVSLELKLADLKNHTRDKIRSVLPPEASAANPVDMIASAVPSSYEAVLKLAAADPGVDGLIAIFVSPIMIDAHEIAKAIVRAAAAIKDKPILTCFMGKENSEKGIQELRRNRIPVYTFPEDAAIAMAALCRYRRIRERPRGHEVTFKVDTAAARKVLKTAAAGKRRDLSLTECRALLDAYGIPFVPTRLALSPAEAIAHSLELGYPVVLKGISRKFTHKTDVGAVRLDLRNADEVGLAFGEMSRSLLARDPDARFAVQKMMRGGKEVIVGVSRDPRFGRLIMFGLGGIYVEIMKDVSFRILPITGVDAVDMIESIRGYPLLKGARGERPVDTGFIAQTLLRVAQLSREFPEIDEMDLNPLMVFEKASDCRVVDARIRLAGGG